jgi:glucan 1,3-beta-glucosidase
LLISYQLEVNMAGNQPGDVGVWNSHFRVGGAAGSKVKTVCSTTPDQCMAAWGMIHLTNTSSAYIENMWGWTADHDLDGGPDSVPGAPVIAVGRGALIEATKGTWLVGTAMEHNTLYQYNFNAAVNVCSVFQQSETPYWQGPGSSDLAPAPWTKHLQPSDPTFSTCGQDDAQCRMAWFELVNASKDIFLYGGCVWVFFNGGVNKPCQGAPGICQQSAIDISNSTGTYLYATNVKAIQNMMISDGLDIALRSDNDGSFPTGGVVAAYLFNSV